MMYSGWQRTALIPAAAVLALTVLVSSDALSQPAPPKDPAATAQDPATQAKGTAPAAEGKAKGAALSAEAKMKALLDPKGAEMTAKAPAVFKARFETSKGNFVIEAHRDWSPLGADRFFNLVRMGYYDEARFFRIIKGFMAQFGINGDPKVNAAWMNAGIPDEPPKMGNTRGRVTFAKRGSPNSRTTQLFINFGDNSQLDGQGFAAFGEVVEGMAVADSLYSGYGEGAPNGNGPDQGQLQKEGNTYLKVSFPKLDYIKKAVIVE
jgi:peptidyl-prolyl cis-trans isomerase A (cyclophilin A)